MANSLRIVATLVARSGSEDKVRALLAPAVHAFRLDPGCEGYILLEDRERPGRFMTYETWANEAALVRHMKSPTMMALAPRLKELLESAIRQDFFTVVV
ncbi:putative quinol monooxygenase [Variovorax sp. J22R24]|uniref:putative quinol monooxygenase n=1 Tax=Variovorax gracilis TaxID=3053502 RepID=UPI002576C7FF|nr:putative quinol monooxygenase [Variovorax sp. J22R24]MDM0106027.1 putative quinol monooxygenase [Variovorax sp. J22R24]